jgi:hypothetical protein
MAKVMTEEEKVEEFMFAMHDTVRDPSPKEEPSMHCPECEQEVYDGLYGYECDRCGLIEPVTL